MDEKTTMSEERRAKGSFLSWIVMGLAALGIFMLGLLASSITERRSESVQARVQFLKPIGEWESDNKVWGISFPREFNSWESTRRMSEMTKYGGSAARDHLEENPQMVVLWAGYPFAKGYNAPRGHMWAVQDVNSTLRRSPATPATCYSCKSPDVPRLMAQDGIAKFYAQKFDHYGLDVKNPIGCADCHNNETMALQISRPALKEAFERQGKDITKATHQEMRSLVCAQCHVEYYFKGKEEKYLTFPWDKGLSVENIEAYYEEHPHDDWTHAISGAKMLKMQHPDYEVYSMGIHAFRGVSCADCHMPYKTEGGIKFTDHQIRSPLENIANSCGVCHRWGDQAIKFRVESIQDKAREMLKRAEEACTMLHLEIADAMRLGATDLELAESRKLVRRAQMYWDFVGANNGMGFHAPQETARILAKSLDTAAEGRMRVAMLRAIKGSSLPLSKPDLSSKDAAQRYIEPFVAKQKAASTQNAPAKP
jgi:nitrite reductase (cytochrome c-552)